MKKLLFVVLSTFYLSNTLLAQTFASSNLPIVIIETDNGATIPDEPKIPATMKIIYNGAGNRNYLSDQNNATSLNYNGRIGIEIRGQSSQDLPKKQYGLTTLKSDNKSNNNVSILGMPKENDWILNGLAFDPSLMRDYISYNLMRQMGNYATRTVYCEVVINGDYKGLYIMQEKIKVASGRVDITKITASDNTLPNLSGGYITKADKVSNGDIVAWSEQSNVSSQWVNYLNELPKPQNATPQQTAYIKGEFDKLSTLALNRNSSPVSGYPTIIDVPSFIDFMIISEFTANVDSYHYSTFFHKERNGKLVAGPIWDYNLTFGNDLFNYGLNRGKPNVWQFSNGDNEGSKFWRNLFYDTQFKCYLSKRWNELIKPNQPLSVANINSFIDETVALISEAVPREKQRWGTFDNHAQEVAKIKSFISTRETWITNNIGSYSACSDVVVPPLVISKIMYNPATDADYPNSKDLEFIEIANNGNKSIDLSGLYFKGTGLIYQFPANTKIDGRSRVILASNAAILTAKYGVKVFGEFSKNLSNDGESLILADAMGNIVDSVTYSNLEPWPNADGNGYFLDLKSLDADNSVAQNWTVENKLEETPKNDEVLSFQIYPNPCSDLLTIKALDVIHEVKIYSLQGQQVRAYNVNSYSTKVAMNDLPQGVYLVTVITSNDTSTNKIVKL